MKQLRLAVGHHGLLQLGVLALLLCAATPAYADFDMGFRQLGDYEAEIVKRVTAVATSAEVTHVTGVLFGAMALGLFVMKCTGWALRGFNLAEFVETVMQILFTGFMLASFTTIVPAIFDASLYVGQAMLTGIAGVSPDSTENASMPVAIVDMLRKYGLSIGPNCDAGWTHPLDCIKGAIVKVVAALTMSVVLALLCIAIMLVDLWGFWIYAIALAIGPVLLPFTLYPRLVFLFDGWLRFFFGVVVYVILARVNLGVVCVAILTSMGTNIQAVVSGGFVLPQQPRINDLVDILGRMLFCSVGIFSLLATGRFASAIVAGAAGGGITFGKAGQAIKKLAKFALKNSNKTQRPRPQPQRPAPPPPPPRDNAPARVVTGRVIPPDSNQRALPLPAAEPRVIVGTVISRKDEIIGGRVGGGQSTIGSGSGGRPAITAAAAPAAIAAGPVPKALPAGSSGQSSSDAGRPRVISGTVVSRSPPLSVSGSGSTGPGGSTRPGGSRPGGSSRPGGGSGPGRGGSRSGGRSRSGSGSGGGSGGGSP